MRVLRIVPWLALPVTLLAASCRDPTQITVRVTTDLACASPPDAGPLDTTPWLARARIASSGNEVDAMKCTPHAADNYIGSIVVVPGPAGDEAKVDVFVVGSVATGPNGTLREACLSTRQNAGDCLVVHRRLSFIPHSPLELPIRLDSRCLNVQCKDTETCIEGACKPIDVNPQPPPPPVDAGSDVQLPPPPSPVVHIVAGGQGTCALRQNGDVVCWGSSSRVLLGPADIIAPTVIAALHGVHGLTLGGSHACAIFPDASLGCWGDASQGQVGNGTTKALGISVVPNPPNAAWDSVVAGANHTCALASGPNVDKPVYCWGRDGEAQVSGLGIPSAPAVLIPTLVAGLVAYRLAPGDNFNCALATPTPKCLQCTNLFCWGENARSQSLLPVSKVAPVTNLKGGLAPSPTAIALGGSHAMGISGMGLIGWGDNTYGQLGTVKGEPFATPVGIDGVTSVIGLALGAQHSCALTTGTPQLTCLGSRASLDLTKLPPLAEIAGGTDHVCGLAKDGRVFCWGSGALGQLGTGASSPDGVLEVTLP